jgi:hypothetical protein
MNDLLIKAEKWLTELGIRTTDRQTVLGVNRDDMASLGATGEIPETTYDNILRELRSAIGSNKFFWGGKDDDWLFLETF